MLVFDYTNDGHPCTDSKFNLHSIQNKQKIIILQKHAIRTSKMKMTITLHLQYILPRELI